MLEMDEVYSVVDIINHWKEVHPEDWEQPMDVWTINTKPFKGAHFATFPLNLVRQPILAGCPIGGVCLDPFAGSGTVGDFCRKNERNAILFELNHGYKPLIVDRAKINFLDVS